LGGAALQRCGKCIVLNPALAAEGTGPAQKRLFPKPMKPRLFKAESKPGLREPVGKSLLNFFPNHVFVISSVD
jgi:hypothetical protein